MQLVAYGAQDIYLTGNPQITFFKVVYRRHTNFSMETILQTLNGLGSTTSNGSTATATISRNGDLVHKVYVAFTTGNLSINGSELVKEAELEIGGQRIDRHYQEWNEVWNELSTPESKAIGLKAMQFSIGSSGTGVGEAHVPLNFWFCRNPGLALPLIALQYHEVKIKFTFGVAGVSPKVWCDYIYLDTDERRRFAQVSHEYLIEQLQKEDKTGAATGGQSKTHKLNFNHPVKELIWTTPANNKMSKIKLQLNGHDRFSEQPEEYFTLRQPFDYHTAVPRQNLPLSARQQTRGLLTSADLGTGTPVTQVDTVTADSTVVTKIVGIGDPGAGLFTGVGNLDGGDEIAIFQVGDGSGDGLVAAQKGKLFFATLTGSQSNSLLSFTGGAINSSSPSEFFSSVDGTYTSATANTVVIFKVTDTTISQARTSQLNKKIGVYSFALKPEEHQPSGTCNFSRIDNAQLIETSSANAPALTVYAVNYNVLRIMSGMGGLAYSN